MIYENEWDDDIGGSDDFVKNEWGDWWVGSDDFVVVCFCFLVLLLCCYGFMVLFFELLWIWKMDEVTILWLLWFHYRFDIVEKMKQSTILKICA